MYTLCKTQYRKSYGDRSNNLISLDSIPVSIEDEEHPANAAVDDIINKETFHNAIDFIRQYLSPMELKIFKLWISNKLSGAVNYDEIEKLMPHSKKSKSQRRKQIDNTISRIKLKVKHFQPELQQIFNGNLPKDVVSYGQWVAFIRTHKGMRFSAPKTYK